MEPLISYFLVLSFQYCVMTYIQKKCIIALMNTGSTIKIFICTSMWLTLYYIYKLSSPKFVLKMFVNTNIQYFM